MAIKDPNSSTPLFSTQKVMSQLDSNALKNTNTVLQKQLELNSSTYLSQYGLTTPTAVKTFLKTPAGKAVVEEIQTEILMEHIIKELNQAMYLADELLKQQMRSAFEHWKEEKKEKLIKRNHLIIEQIEELQTRLAKKETIVPLERTTQDVDQLMNHYDDLIRDVELQQKVLIHKKLALEAERRAFETEELSVREQYALYDEYTHDNYFEPLKNEDDLIQCRHIISEEIDILFQQINKNIEQGQNAKSLIHQQNACHQRRDRLDEMLAVHKQEKVYLDPHGNTSSSAKEAHFIVSKDKKLIHEHGEYFLLNANQDWQTVKNNPEARADAKKSFSDTHMALMTVKVRLRHNEQIDLSACKKQLNDNALAIAQINLEQRSYENKIRELQSAQAIMQKQLQASMNNNQKNNAIPQQTPRPAPSSSINMPTAKPFPSAKLKQSLNELKSSLNQFNTPNRLTPDRQVNQSRELITSLFSQHSKLSALLPLVREQIFLQMAKYGVQSSLQNQFKHKITSSVNNQYEETLPYKNKVRGTEHKSPTPFNMTPDPYKK